MLQIHLIQAAQAIPFVKVLEQAGAPVEKLCELASLPIGAISTGEGVIGEYALWRLVDLAARHQRQNLFGYEVASQYPIDSLDGLGGLSLPDAPTLKVLLECFIEDVQCESTGCLYSLSPGMDGLWFVREPMFGDNRKNWQVEQYMITIIIQLIRLCAGPGWLPPRVNICSVDDAQQIPEEWKSIEFIWGSKNTEISIPNGVLSHNLVKPSKKPVPDVGDSSDSGQKAPLEFSDLVKTQILTKNLGLDNAAKQTGLSPKTLKRRLSSQGTSYTELVDQLRFQLAGSMVKETDMSMSAIAEKLGYQHQSSFTRSFKRICGIAPQDYRRECRIKANPGGSID